MVEPEPTWLEAFSAWLVDFVHGFGYLGIFIMTFLESTFAPIPAEVTMIPAGYLVYQGEMNFWLVMIISIAGTVGGSLFNYWLAMKYGRRFILAYGKYVLLKPEKMMIIEKYFTSHGEISVFTGRLLPGLRHFISFPAGLALMDLKKFCFFTAAGGGIWMLILALLGYAIGGNKELVKQYTPLMTYLGIAFVLLMVLLYVMNQRRKSERANRS